jgi:hypothetical protein
MIVFFPEEKHLMTDNDIVYNSCFILQRSYGHHRKGKRQKFSISLLLNVHNRRGKKDEWEIPSDMLIDI